MHKKVLTLITLFFILFGFSACAMGPMGPKIVGVTTELDDLFVRDFKGFDAPELKMKSEGEGKSFPYTTFDEVWESVIIVLMQQGIIMRASKDTGVIVAVTTPPLAVFVEKGKVIKVYLYWLESLYGRTDKPEEVLFKLEPDTKKKMTEVFFGKLATQIYASNKWKYLYK